jgi:cyclopropane-fatty-acyl-phospholipid synthase
MLQSSTVDSSVVSSAPLRHRFAARAVLSRIPTLPAPGLDIILPDGRRASFGERSALPPIRIRVHDWRAFGRILRAGEIGAGEAFMAGEWSTNDLVGACRLFVDRHARLGRVGKWSWPDRIATFLRRIVRANSLPGSRRNVRAHYDLGNELFRLFLDESMTYSAAVYAEEGESLETAQRRKLDIACRSLPLAANDHVLEIGSGWGSFALHAAGVYGARVTTITLSREQERLVRERARAAGLADRIDVRFCDYRQLSGSFDHLVSIEMFEAVGYEYYTHFFSACDRLLADGGSIFLQTITIPDQRFDAYRRADDWSRRHVFPGSLLASQHAILETLKHHTTLRLESLVDIGLDYARTLGEWRTRFLANLAAVRRLG